MAATGESRAREGYSSFEQLVFGYMTFEKAYLP